MPRHARGHPLLTGTRRDEGSTLAGGVQGSGAGDGVAHGRLSKGAAAHGGLAQDGGTHNGGHCDEREMRNASRAEPERCRKEEVVRSRGAAGKTKLLKNRRFGL